MSSFARRTRRLRRKLRPYYPVLWLLIVTVVLSGLWVAGHALLASRDLRAVQRDLVALEQLGTRADSTSVVTRLVANVQDNSRSARSHTDDLAWKVWTHAPLIGSSLTVAAGISATGADLSKSALPTLATTAQAIPSLRRPDGQVILAPLHARASGLRSAAVDVSHAHARVAALPHSRLGLVQGNRDKLQSQLLRLRGRAEGLAVAAAVGPDLLGEKGSRRYLIAVQNNAEARASGGIVGAYGLLRMTRGRATLEHFGPDTDLRGTATNAIDFGPEWRSRYDVLGAARDWREVTTTPDFPTAGATMLALWAKTHAGEKLDGVLSVDPVALALILQATGPITGSDRQRLEAATFVKRTLSDVYQQYPNKAQRSAVLTEDARAVFHALATGRGGAPALAERLGRAVITQHLKFFSSHPTTQAQLAKTALAAALPSDAAPLLSVITQDANADKLSYYLRRHISYSSALAPQQVDFGDGHGPRSQQLGQLTVRLENTAPASGLPDYVAPAIDLSDGATIARGRMKIAVSVYLGKAGQLDSAQLGGRSIPMSSQTEKGLAVFTTTVWLDPGQSKTLTLSVRQPVVPGMPLRVLPQPLAFADDFS